MSSTIDLDGKTLSLDDVELVMGNSKVNVIISKDARERMASSYKYVQKIAAGNKPVYGINTGFGVLADKRIEPDKLHQLQVNLIRSHCTGVGRPFSEEVVRTIMLLRANCLTCGYSGINPKIVDTLCDFISFRVSPIVPEQGSVGASGDLAPLSHIALGLIGEGDVYFDGKEMAAKEVFSELNILPASLGAKDGLALINGTAAMAALEALGIIKARNLFKVADIVAAMTLDAIQGTDVAYDMDIAKVKPHPGQLSVSKNLKHITDGSQILKNHKGCNRVQDPYSLRCVPQVHGACRQALLHATEVLNIELNSVTDNPLIFSDSDKVVSGGNFHGEALALSMDYLSMSLTELCNISERRIEKMMNPSFSGLPFFLSEDPGFNSGMMITQVTAAALASENKYLSHPASTDTIPTSTDKEDHVSMGVTSGRKLHNIIDNFKNVLAIEVLCSCQAIEMRRPLVSSPAIEAVVKLVREQVPFLKEDRVLHKDISKIAAMIDSGKIVKCVEQVTGKLE